MGTVSQGAIIFLGLRAGWLRGLIAKNKASYIHQLNLCPRQQGSGAHPWLLPEAAVLGPGAQAASKLFILSACLLQFLLTTCTTTGCKRKHTDPCADTVPPLRARGPSAHRFVRVSLKKLRPSCLFRCSVTSMGPSTAEGKSTSRHLPAPWPHSNFASSKLRSLC